MDIEKIMALVGHVKEYWVQYTAAILAFVRFVEAFIAATETKKDDVIMAKIKEIAKQYFKIGW